MKIFKLLFHRVVIVSLAMLVQLAFVLLSLVAFRNYSGWFEFFSVALSVCVVLHIICGSANPSYKIAWIIPILLLPVFGGIFYVFFGGERLPKRVRKKMLGMEEAMCRELRQDPALLDELRELDPDAAKQAKYLGSYGFCPVYRNQGAEFFPMGEDWFAAVLREIEKAERFIFMEFFIIQEGKMWDPVLDILKRKAAAGVDVRVIFDDLGCIMLLPNGYEKTLRSAGIKCQVFNPFIPRLSTVLNNRDHRKILVVDGHTGFTGGINFGDEYINEYERCGHWKDCGIMLRGEAVRSMTVMFLSMWDYISGEKSDYTLHYPPSAETEAEAGWVQPYTDCPMDDENVGETVYHNIIASAQRYVFINTPYLILDHDMRRALCRAAKSGVDVRICVPSVPDKWYVHAVTRANYPPLVQAGVKIYEYSPGFVHAKTFVCDDRIGTVGSVNLDFRSLYLHFECGVWLCGVECIEKMREDYIETLKSCRLITREELDAAPLPKKLMQRLLSIFSPLM